MLDPCWGSGHFLVAAFVLLVVLRIQAEKLSAKNACDAVLRENLHGLELDPRCTQIAAFALALTVWKFTEGFRPLPPLNIACSGLGVNAQKEDWLALANGDRSLLYGMEQLYDLFQKAPELGSLINPQSIAQPDSGYVQESDLYFKFTEIQPLLTKALQSEKARKNDDLNEIGVAAWGMTKAAEMLGSPCHLVVTNVPYLGREGHSEVLVNFADAHNSDASADLATLMIDRCVALLHENATLGVVAPQNWWIGKAYVQFRKKFLESVSWRLAVVLGEEAWHTFGNRGPNTVLLIVENESPPENQTFAALDVSTKPGMPVVSREEKAAMMSSASASVNNHGQALLTILPQKPMLSSRDNRITIAQMSSISRLSEKVIAGEGSSTGDGDRFLRVFWEVCDFKPWLRYCEPGAESALDCDCTKIVWWEDGLGELARSPQARIQNTGLWKKNGVLVGRVRGITAARFNGGRFSKGAVMVSPKDPKDFLPVLAFLRSRDYENLVRSIDPRVSAATSILTDVPFDFAHWQKIATEKFPHGLPEPSSDDPRQWSFNGQTGGSTAPLQVGVARLLGYRWPRQTGQTVSGTAPVPEDGLEKLVDEDGIVCIPSVRGEAPAAERLRALLPNPRFSRIHAVGFRSEV